MIAASIHFLQMERGGKMGEDGRGWVGEEGGLGRCRREGESMGVSACRGERGLGRKTGVFGI